MFTASCRHQMINQFSSSFLGSKSLIGQQLKRRDIPIGQYWLINPPTLSTVFWLAKSLPRRTDIPFELLYLVPKENTTTLSGSFWKQTTQVYHSTLPIKEGREVSVWYVGPW